MTPVRARRDRSGPVSVPDARTLERRLRNLEVTIAGRLEGLLPGNYRGVTLGIGSEPGEGRLYRIGDDVRRMDWKLTARAGAPHVRDTIADRELEIWFIVDRSASLDFGTARYRKRELVLGAIAALGFLGTRSGGKVGAVLSGAGPLVSIPARPGRLAVRRVLVEASDARSGDVTPVGAGFADALRHAQDVLRRRALVVVVSDFLVDHQWELPMRGLRARHELIAVEVLDPRELELPAIGSIEVCDPETGRQLEVRTSRALREAYAEQAALHRQAVHATLRTVRADHLVLRTDSDWVKDVARFLRRRRVTAQRAVSGGYRVPSAAG